MNFPWLPTAELPFGCATVSRAACTIHSPSSSTPPKMRLAVRRNCRLPRIHQRRVLAAVAWKIHFGRRNARGLGAASGASASSTTTTRYAPKVMLVVMWNIYFGKICPTYPRRFMVPHSVSDSVIRHAARFRARSRLPILSYRHGCGSALVRSSQALVGLQRARSVQDERLVSVIRDLAPSRLLLIVDARPTRSAMANTLSGAGSMPLENYAGCSRVHLGIENIHAVRESYLTMARLRLAGASERTAMAESGWLGHYTRIMEGARIICQHLQNGMAVLVHCSDGWDRTAQLVSLVQLCLDPHTRTVAGLCRLIQREWVAAGHQFERRLGRLLPINALLAGGGGAGSKSAAAAARTLSNMILFSEAGDDQQLRDEFCPIFPQFIDCLRQLMRVYPRDFEFGPRLLDELLVEVYCCRTATFRGNNDRERGNIAAGGGSSCFWTDILRTGDRMANPNYRPSETVLMIDDDVLFHA